MTCSLDRTTAEFNSLQPLSDGRHTKGRFIDESRRWELRTANWRFHLQYRISPCGVAYMNMCMHGITNTCSCASFSRKTFALKGLFNVNSTEKNLRKIISIRAYVIFEDALCSFLRRSRIENGSSRNMSLFISIRPPFKAFTYNNTYEHYSKHKMSARNKEKNCCVDT